MPDVGCSAGRSCWKFTPDTKEERAGGCKPQPGVWHMAQGLAVWHHAFKPNAWHARCQRWEIDEREFDRWNMMKYAYWGIFIDTPSPYENDLLMTLQAKVCFNATGAGMRQSLKSSRSMGTFCKLERKEHDGLNSMQQNQCLDRYLSRWMISYYFRQDVGEHWVDLFSDFSNSLVVHSWCFRSLPSTECQGASEFGCGKEWELKKKLWNWKVQFWKSGKSWIHNALIKKSEGIIIFHQLCDLQGQSPQPWYKKMNLPESLKRWRLGVWIRWDETCESAGLWWQLHSGNM